MEADAGEEREIRAARNQAMFRAVNETMQEARGKFTQALSDNVAVCECARADCLATIPVPVEAYQAVRANQRTFIVHPGHVFPDVERVVEDAGSYMVVEKLGRAGEVVEAPGGSRAG